MKYMKNQVFLRPVTEADAEALVNIYAYYVTDTAITFEYEVPAVEEFRTRIKNISAKFPYIVAELDGKPVGYAYASTFKGRAAYDWCVETSIYVERNYLHDGIGRKLLEALENNLKRLGYLNVNACITYPEVEDEYQDRNSVQFHDHMGYRMVGEFRKCGYKFKRWYNMVWMEKFLGEHQTEQPAVKKWDGKI